MILKKVQLFCRIEYKIICNNLSSQRRFDAEPRHGINKTTAMSVHAIVKDDGLVQFGSKLLIRLKYILAAIVRTAVIKIVQENIITYL